MFAFIIVLACSHQFYVFENIQFQHSLTKNLHVNSCTVYTCSNLCNVTVKNVWCGLCE
jgi:hypothetical protein